jgi:hypothetical protein
MRALRRIALPLAVLLPLSLLVLPAAAPGADCLPSPIYVPPCGAWHGVATNPNVQTLAGFESAIGQKVDILREFRTFQSFDEPGESFPGSTAQAAIDGRRMYLWSWRPQQLGSSLYLSWADIAAGRYDASHIDPTADKVRAWSQAHGGKKTFMAFHHEPEPSRGTAAEYVAAWRHIYDRFVARRARPYVIFTWVMTGFRDRVKQWGPMYPSDAYVDWIGYDPYALVCENVTTGTPAGFATAFGEQAGTDVDDTGKYRFYKWATGPGAVDGSDGRTYVKPGSFTKPIMVAEYGAAHSSRFPTAMEQFFRDEKAALSAGKYPRIKAFVYFQGHSSCNRVDSTAGTKAAYRELVAIPRLNQPLPY